MIKLHQGFLTFYTFLFSPLIILLLACSYLYRRIVEIILRLRLKEKFAGFLNGTDCVWAVEHPSALSVNNILLIIEKDARHSNNNFLERLRELVKHRIVCSPFEKLLYKRKRKFGYYFWERSEEIDLSERVRWLEYERANCDGSCDNIYNGHLKRVLWNVCNQPLPENHTASWEILVGKCCPRSSHHYLRRMEERLTSKIRIPILFRVHHSLGDGMALLKFFRDVIIDKEPVPETFLQLESTDFRIKTEKGKSDNLIRSTIDSVNVCLNADGLKRHFEKDVMSASMPFIHFVVLPHFVKALRERMDAALKYLKSLTVEDLIRETKEFARKERDRLNAFFADVVCNKASSFFKMAQIGLGVPGFLIQQAFRSMDKSALHGAELSGEKLVSYWLEDDFKNACDQKLFTKIQNVKSITGAKFGDVLLAALSVSLHKYFLRLLYGDTRKFSPIQFSLLRNQRKFLLFDVYNVSSFHDGQKSASDLLLRYIIKKGFECKGLTVYINMNEPIPTKLSVVIPMKIEEWIETLPLQNNFSVGILPLCVSQINGKQLADPMENSQILERLEDIKNANEALRKGPDYRANFLVMKYLSALLPDQLLRPIFKSHSTMVFSNLVGPQEVKLLGHPLKNMVFWIPNRSLTGIGCSLLTYRGYLHLSIIADKALIQNEKALTKILENTVNEIDNLYDRLTLSFFSKKLHRSISTPTKKAIGVL